MLFSAQTLNPYHSHKACKNIFIGRLAVVYSIKRITVEDFPVAKRGAIFYRLHVTWLKTYKSAICAELKEVGPQCLHH